MELTTKNLGEILKKDKVIVDFWAPWCGPCLALAPIIEEISSETGVELVKCNIEDFSEIAEKYKVMSIPTVIVLEQGIIKGELIGVRQKKSYLDLIN